MVAINAKYSVYVEELLRNAALLSKLNEQAAERKLVSLLILSLGTAARKSLTDKFSYIDNFHNIHEGNERKL